MNVHQKGRGRLKVVGGDVAHEKNWTIHQEEGWSEEGKEIY